ncbi:hypothetical protein IV203_008425 [Nitzschia inconspicua]|uniref:Uncharacterized protein n=1 Tax=Nitzschia inconspicua TaxID=303405 RepID=A0A9K3PM06_9STRA|nr:hypothetical protein IV203_008425 [Nitzschia inconspicua]
MTPTAVAAVMIPEELFLSFFKNATSALLYLKGSEAMEADDGNNNPSISDPLSSSRRYILTLQQNVVREVVQEYQRQEESLHVDEYHDVTVAQFQVHLRQLGNDPNISSDVKAAMEGMNEAARLALCKLVLYWQQALTTPCTEKQSLEKRNLQESPIEPELDRTRLLEYFGLCQAALKLHSVKNFMIHGDKLFDYLPSECTAVAAEKLSVENEKILLPKSRFEYVQQLLAKAMGWDPVFLTKELQKIFVERDDSLALVHDDEVSKVFQELLQDMQIAIRTSFLLMQHEHQVQLLSDLESGGSTRVVSVKYSEYDITPDGHRLDEGVSDPTAAPETLTMEPAQELSEEQQKRQIRLAHEAAVLQQEILGELLRLPEHERNNRLEEAERTSQDFVKEVMTLRPGSDRIAFLRTVDPHTSRQLAMHKIWKDMIQANGGRPPMLAEK